ncbi:50S ribosomal protein L22, partial [Xanthomonas citri pv. citri]|nr:50S ribosomal protein L22 [Xanthomonas citri pv. citri]
SAHITVVVEPKEARRARKKATSGRPAAAAKSETEKGA